MYVTLYMYIESAHVRFIYMWFEHALQCANVKCVVKVLHNVCG
jgi:hypothetical protein